MDQDEVMEGMAVFAQLLGQSCAQVLDAAGLGEFVGAIAFDADAIREHVAQVLAERDGETLSNEVEGFLANL